MNHHMDSEKARLKKLRVAFRKAWGSHWFAIALQLLAVAACVFIWIRPASSVAIGILGAAAAIMSIRKMTRFEKFGWVVVVFLLLGVELRAIRVDREQHEKEVATMIQLAEDSIGTMTGGSSFCFLEMDPRGGPLLFPHRGKYPLYEVDARIVDLQKVNEFARQNKGTSEMANVTKLDINIHIGTITPNSSAGAPNVLAIDDAATRQSLNIFFHGRNGFWTQLLRARKVNGQWLKATRVFAYDMKEKKLESIDDGFPRLPNGEVDWNEDWDNPFAAPKK